MRSKRSRTHTPRTRGRTSRSKRQSAGSVVPRDAGSDPGVAAAEPGRPPGAEREVSEPPAGPEAAEARVGGARAGAPGPPRALHGAPARTPRAPAPSRAEGHA